MASARKVQVFTGRWTKWDDKQEAPLGWRAYLSVLRVELTETYSARILVVFGPIFSPDRSQDSILPPLFSARALKIADQPASPKPFSRKLWRVQERCNCSLGSEQNVAKGLHSALEAGERGAGLDGFAQLVDPLRCVRALQLVRFSSIDATELVRRQAASASKVQLFIGRT